jgi:hypothetical protein
MLGSVLIIKHAQKSTGEIRYEYTCCNAAVTGVTVTCESSQSTNEDYNELSVLNLDRLWVDAGQYRFINSLKLNDIGDGQWNYTYKSCSVNSSVITTFDTGCNDEGSGSIHYLDRHEVECGSGNAINWFGLKRDDYQIHYAYGCVYNPKSISTTCTTNYTAWNSIRTDKPKESLNYLDRHDIRCPTDSAITRFKLERKSGSDSIRYSYDCCKASVKNCVGKATADTDYGGWRAYYLDRQLIDGQSDRIIQQFRLEPDEKDFGYNYIVCDLA